MVVAAGVVHQPRPSQLGSDVTEERVQPVHGQVRPSQQSRLAASQPLVRQPRAVDAPPTRIQPSVLTAERAVADRPDRQSAQRQER